MGHVGDKVIEHAAVIGQYRARADSSLERVQEQLLRGDEKVDDDAVIGQGPVQAPRAGEQQGRGIGELGDEPVGNADGTQRAGRLNQPADEVPALVAT